MSPLHAHLLACLPQRPRAEVEALAAALEKCGITSPTELPQRDSPFLAKLPMDQQTMLLLALSEGPFVDLQWREALEDEGGSGLLRLVVLEAGIHSASKLKDWTGFYPGRWTNDWIEQVHRAAARCGVVWGELTTWKDALHRAGGAPLVRRARDAGIDSLEALARLTTGDLARRGGWGRVRLQQLRRAALSVGLDWAPDLGRGPGAPSLSGDGESPRESVSLPPGIRAQVRERAKAEGISASAWIRRAVEAALAEGERR